MASNDNGGALLLAFIAGAVTGAAVALMFAPAAGDETRGYLGERARASRDHLTMAFDRARQQYQERTGPGAPYADASAPKEEPQA